MTSNMLSGERRWASARRGGMTVLGKVAVPKPINLPSQRLENHGLDPNVEIVPKGTLSWGSRPSSSGSNPWVSSSISPGADGGTVSPSHLSGRPSSGGSGTRPSTAGSDKTHEPVASAWGSNSRPSSASGTLSSNQTSLASLRPRSAENRPNSSQLSRFADNGSKSSAAWGPSGTAERLGVKSSKEDAFSLSSGDFPSLGSDKDNSVKNSESEERGRPSSASGRIAQDKEDAKYQADVKHGSVNTWRADGSHSAEDDMRPSMEKWQGDPHQYYSVNTGPQHFDAWHGPPLNAPAGPWYGGRPRGPPFGAPVPPGGFPVEPFPYYRPQIPPPPLAGSQPVPPPGPRGPHPKNGDFYRPQMPDAYARPGMPFRPGFYPGPRGPPGPMAFEGYYGPPMGYSERDIPYMGMPAGPPVYNGYPPAAPDNSPGRTAGRGPAGKTFSEHVETEHLEDTQGPKRVHLYNHNDYQREEGENREHKVHSYPGKTRIPMTSTRHNEWGAEEVAEEVTDAKRKTPSGDSSRGHEYRVHATDTVKIKSFGGTRNIKAVDDNWVNKSEGVLSLPPEMPQIPPASERDSSIPTAKRNSALMHKIDGLNAKARVSDGRNDSSSAYNREEERKGSQIPDMKINKYTSEVSNAAGSFERIPVSRDFVNVPHEVIVPVVDKPIPMAVMSRRSYHGEHGRVDHRVKGKFSSQEADGWRKKPLSTEYSSEIAASNIEPAPNTHAHGPTIVGEAPENSIINRAEKFEGDSVESCDSTDIQAQRAKMRELAKQRALQLQKEEEERTKEQKAKALAKLEELNRRSLIVEAGNQKAERTQTIGNIGGEQEESRTAITDIKFQEPGWNLVSDPDIAAVDRGNSADQAGESVEESRNLPLEVQQAGLLKTKVSPLPMDDFSHDGSAKKVIAQSNDGGISKHKRTGYKQKQNTLLQKSSNQISVSKASGEHDDPPHAATTDVTIHEGPSSETKVSESNAYNTSNTVVEHHTHQRRKNNRGGKNKHKLDETSAVTAVPPVALDIIPGNESIVHDEPKDSLSNLDGSVSTVIVPDSGVQAPDTCSSLPNEESHSKVSNQLKPNPSRRFQKGHQANRFVEKPHVTDTVVWAPVRPQNKAKDSVEASQKSMQEPANSTKDNYNMAQNSLKGKRAEMERYVPKPVAKEMSQQGSFQPLAPSISSSRSNEGGSGSEQSGSASSAVPQPATGNVESSGDTNEWDDTRNKHKKDQGSWKQRASSNSSHMKGVHARQAPISESTKVSEQSKDLVQSMKSEVNPANAAEPTASGVVNPTTGSNMPNTGATVRGKRHQPRGPRSTGTNPDSNNTFSSEVDGNSVQSAGPDANQSDRSVASKENRSFGERTSSHWQPKSNSNYSNNQHGDRTTGSESVTRDNKGLPKKDHAQHKMQAQRRHDKEGINLGQSQPGQYANVQSNVGEETNVGHRQEFDREKKSNPSKGRPFSPNQDGWNDSTPTPNTDDQIERTIPSGSRRNARQNNRPIRGHESRGDWSSGYDNRPHNAPAFRDRQRQNVHLEYQPVGPFRGNKPEKADMPTDGAADSADQRHGERGQTHPKRGGNSHRRPSGTVNVDSGWN